MDISEQHHGSTPKGNHPEPRPEAAAPERHTNWISYAVAVVQQVPAGGANCSADSEF